MITCILCPNGCKLDIVLEDNMQETCRIAVNGNLCEKGVLYAREELTNPVRTFTTTLIVREGEYPLVSVKTSIPIPIDAIAEVRDQLRTFTVCAPIRLGECLVSSVAGTDASIVATQDVELTPETQRPGKEANDHGR